MKSILFISILSLFCFTGMSSVNEPTPSPTASETSCRLQLIGLECIRTEGFVSADAIYFKVDWGNGTEEWPKSRLNMLAGDYVDMRGVNSTSLGGQVTFNMYDDDTWDADDHLGTKSISCGDAGAGEKFLSFTQDGAYYKLHYKVY